MKDLDRLLPACAVHIQAEGLKCPLPLLKTKKALASLTAGSTVYLRATDANSMRDLLAFAAEAHHEVLHASKESGLFEFVIRKGPPGGG